MGIKLTPASRWQGLSLPMSTLPTFSVSPSDMQVSVPAGYPESYTVANVEWQTHRGYGIKLYVRSTDPDTTPGDRPTFTYRMSDRLADYLYQLGCTVIIHIYTAGYFASEDLYLQTPRPFMMNCFSVRGGNVIDVTIPNPYWHGTQGYLYVAEQEAGGAVVLVPDAFEQLDSVCFALTPCVAGTGVEFT